MNQSRINAKIALGHRFKKQRNIDIVESYIFEYTNSDREYLGMVYEMVCSGCNAKDMILRITSEKTGWGNPKFDPIRDSIQEQDRFIESPIEIEEGVGECSCGSKKTLSYSKQTRSCDEATTVFFTCVECGNKWRE